METRRVRFATASRRRPAVRRSNRNSIAPHRLAAFFVSIFAALALGLGTIGIYSVMAYHFAERKAEIALRLALGAERRHIIGLAWRRRLGLLAPGALIGSAVVFCATRLLLPFSHGQPLDVGIFGSALVVLLTIGFGAAFVPALGATRANPSLSRSLC